MVVFRGFLWIVGISNSSLLHIVLSFFPCKCSGPEKTQTDEESQKSNAIVYSEPKLVCPEEFVLDSDSYGEPVIGSLIFHIFGDSINSLKEEGESSPCEEDVASIVDSDFSIVKTALQTPFFQDILSDISFVRKLLLVNDDIIEITKTNPGLLDFINNDDSLRDVIKLISDTTAYQDYHNLRLMVIRKIETALGNHLNFKKVL